MPIRAGELRHYVTIRKEATETLDGAGNPSVATWTTWTAHVGIEPMSMAERAYAGAMGAEATHKITARYDSRLDNTCRIAYGTREFRVTSAITKDERNREMTLMAAETVGDTVSLTSLYGLSFSGAQYATYAGRLRTGAQGTIGMWVKPGAWVTGAEMVLLACGKSATTSYFKLRLIAAVGGQWTLGFVRNPTPGSGGTVTGNIVNEWMHVAVAMDGVNTYLYRDGILASSVVGGELWSACPSDSYTAIGGLWNGSAYVLPYTGEIVAPFAADGPLNATQILALMVNTAPLNLGVWYPGEASGTTLTDQSGNEINMSLDEVEGATPTRTGPYTSLSGGPG